jgi:CheY-like chemotaxis protein
MMSDYGGKSATPFGRGVPSETFAEAASELNNLLQILGGSCAEIKEMLEGIDGAEDCLETLRTTVKRVGVVAAHLADQAGATDQKVLINPELAALKSPENVTKMPAHRPAILVVDDEKLTLALMKHILTTAGYRVTTAESSADALYLFRRRRNLYQLVILDLHMPGTDGEETFYQLRQIRHDVPVVLCTGFIQADQLDRLIKAGLSGFLRKPLAPEEIVSHVHALLEIVKVAHAETLKEFIKKDREGAA